MKKFNLGKKSDGDEDSSRLALFGSRTKSKSPAQPATNPYATAPPDPYTQAKMNAGLLPQPNPGRGTAPGPPRGGLPSGPAPTGSCGASPRGSYGAASQPDSRQGGPGGDNRYGAPQGNSGGDSRYGAPQGSSGGDSRYGAPQGGYGATGYGADRYGTQNGFGGANLGNNQYGGGAQNASASRYGPGGYGGLGRSTSNDTTTTDDNRAALFGGAQERVQRQQQTGYGGAPSNEYGSAQGPGENRSYGAYGDRQLTAEEEEEEDVEATKQDIRFMKQQDVASTRNALRIAAQAEETGRNTLARLGAQGERIHNTERNLDISANHNRDAEDKARELKTINRSMWAVHVNSPFGGKDRREKRDEAVMTKHRTEREQREASREQAFKSDQRMQQNFRGLQGGPGGSIEKTSLAERAKYQFEADSEDDERENEIESNLDALSGAAGRLNLLARATGQEVEEQNRHLIRIGDKSDKVDDQLHLNTERLRRIH